MKYKQLDSIIKTFSRPGSVPGLERVRKLCDLLYNPENKCKTIHVAGTNGKGSVCAHLESVYKTAGVKTGLYTSPHLVRVNERFRIDGKEIEDNELFRLVETISKVSKQNNIKPTEFEILTAVAFLWFSENNCDIVILETGLGGRFDATNVVTSPLCSVITSISVDHTDFLGNTVEQIAFEKAGIIKDGSPVVIGDFSKVKETLVAYANQKGSKTFLVDKTAIAEIFHNDMLQKFEYDKKEYEITLLGKHQIQNAVIAIETVETVNKKDKDLFVSNDKLKQGLKQTVWNARFQAFCDNYKPIIIDGAHNVAGAKSLAQAIRRHYSGKEFTVIAGVLGDKQWHTMFDIFCEISNDFVLVTPNNPRALPKEEIYNYIESKPKIKAIVEHSLKSAERLALSHKTDGVIICGSLYLAGEYLEMKSLK